MESQSSEIKNQLCNHGWKIADRALRPTWWADEVWRLESIWSPIGACAFLTFLVDPQNDDNDRKKGRDVWAVKASPREPDSYQRSADEYELALGRGWKAELPELFAKLDRFRNGA